jgi:hypothetical protein
VSQKTRLDKNSATKAVEGFKGAIDDIQPPAGVELNSDEEEVIWGQFTRARAREDWRDMDLILLSKIVKLEVGIRRHQETLDRSGILIKNKRETLVVNPLMSVIDTLERRQLAIIRSMSLNQTANDPRTINVPAWEGNQTRALVGDNSVHNLLARPIN